MLSHLKNLADILPCDGGNFFGLPHWYKYICNREFKIPEDIPWVVPLVGLAVLEIMLRIAAVLAIGYVIYGAIKYETSQGDAGKISEAKNAIINALVGLMIATLAIAIVAFLGNRLGH